MISIDHSTSISFIFHSLTRIAMSISSPHRVEFIPFRVAYIEARVPLKNWHLRTCDLTLPQSIGGILRISSQTVVIVVSVIVIVLAAIALAVLLWRYCRRDRCVSTGSAVQEREPESPIQVNPSQMESLWLSGLSSGSKDTHVSLPSEPVRRTAESNPMRVDVRDKKRGVDENPAPAPPKTQNSTDDPTHPGMWVTGSNPIQTEERPSGKQSSNPRSSTDHRHDDSSMTGRPDVRMDSTTSVPDDTANPDQ
jgi:hypothetical protein